MYPEDNERVWNSGNADIQRKHEKLNNGGQGRHDFDDDEGAEKDEEDAVEKQVSECF